MKIYIKNHDYRYEIENLCRIFFQNKKFKILDDSNIIDCNEDYILTSKEENNDEIILYVCVKYNGEIQEDSVILNKSENDKECERILAVMLFKILKNFTKINPSWGILTGIRPVKLMRKLVSELGSKEKAREYFINRLMVYEEKADLALKTMNLENNIINLSKPSSFSLYISIPFCPTRCSYCSFVSQSVQKSRKLIPDYLNCLLEEIVYTAKIVNKLNLKLETVYVGGGTPTVLDSNQLEILLRTINNNFDVNNCREFTVEAGRPDTITEEKLLTIKNNLVTRISINPQTMNDHVLQNIGRKHNSKQTVEAYNIAKECGFENINMDVIVGLPGESLNSFKNSLNKICELEPAGITIHTLSMKRASNLTKQNETIQLKDYKRVSDMINFAYKILDDNDYNSYYLYRQSRMVGNMENVGFSKRGKEGLYNVFIMDETHTILACGAGAVTKLKEPNGNLIERIFNYKFPYEYISDFNKMLDRKRGIVSFYETFQ